MLWFLCRAIVQNNGIDRSKPLCFSSLPCWKYMKGHRYLTIEFCTNRSHTSFCNNSHTPKSFYQYFDQLRKFHKTCLTTSMEDSPRDGCSESGWRALVSPDVQLQEVPSSWIIEKGTRSSELLTTPQNYLPRGTHCWHP